MNTDDLIGIPYVRCGRTLKGLDCWGLILIGQARLGIEVPDVLAWSDQEAVKAQQAELPSDDWIRARFAGWEKIERPVEGSIVVFKNVDGFAVHVGMMVDDREFLHTMQKTGVVRTRLAREPWCSLLVGAYVYRR